MPNSDYSQVKITKKRRHFFGQIKILVVSMICLIITYYSADILSDFLTIGVSNFSIFESKTSYKIDNYYLLTFAQEQSNKAAQSKVTNCVAYGGGGFVYDILDNYYVVANVYLSEQNANKVVEQIGEIDMNVSVVELKTNEYNFNLNQLSSIEQTNVKNSFDSLVEIVPKLIDYSNKLDTKAMSKNNISSSLNSYNSTLKNNLQILQNINQKYDNQSVILLITTYQNIISSLDVCVAQLIASDSVTTIKYCVSECLYQIKHIST